jgi:RNA recognition motif-containing protein
LQKLPKTINRVSMLKTLDANGFHALYDFLYLPLSYKDGKSLGFAFVNFTSHAHAMAAIKQLSSICSPVWSQKRQGLSDLIGHYRDTTVTSQNTPDEYKPILLSNGVRVGFPGEECEQTVIKMAEKQSAPTMSRAGIVKPHSVCAENENKLIRVSF